MEDNKYRIISIAGTVAFHFLLILILLVYYIRPVSDRKWSEELSGVPVMFGNVSDAFGNDEPFGRGDAEVAAPLNENITSPNEVETAVQENPPSSLTEDESLASQDFEETVDIRKINKAEQEKRAKEAAEAERVKKEAEAARLAALEEQKKKEIATQMAGLFGNGTGSGSRGETEGQGTQGVPTGNASYGKTSGVGGWGEYDLGGRGVGRGGLIKPSYTANDYGTVVIDIIVDPQGNVVSADIGRGTNTPSSALKSEALKAARRTKFATTSKPGNQKGTITYKFNLN